jgi:hypothetical protein
MSAKPGGMLGAVNPHAGLVAIDNGMTAFDVHGGGKCGGKTHGSSSSI